MFATGLFGRRVVPSKSERATVQVAGRTLGFPEPPATVTVSWSRKRGHWLMRVRSSASALPQVRLWASGFGATSTDSNTTSLWLRFASLRPEWETLAAQRGSEVELSPDGRAVATLAAPRAFIEQLKRADAEGRVFVHEHMAPIARPRLTLRQRFVLHSAVEWGYYDVPRRITLEEVARRLGIGLNTLSVVLRNAEAAVVRNFARFDPKPSRSGGRPRPTPSDDGADE